VNGGFAALRRLVEPAERGDPGSGAASDQGGTRYPGKARDLSRARPVTWAAALPVTPAGPVTGAAARYRGSGAAPRSASNCRMVSTSVVWECTMFAARVRTAGSLAWMLAYWAIGVPPS